MIHLAGVWWLPHFLTQDGSAHLYTVAIFLQLVEGSSPLIADTYRYNDWYVPAWGGGLYLALPVKLFGYITAEKLLISSIIILLGCGFRFLLNALKVEDKYGHFLILPFLFNHILLTGLYYYLLSLSLSLFLFAKYQSKIGEMTRGDRILLSLSFLLIFYIHPLPPALIGFGLLLHSLWKTLRDKTISGKTLFREWFRLGLCGLPCLVIGVLYVNGSAYDGEVAAGIGVGAVLQSIATGAVLISFDLTPLWWIMLFVAVLLVISLRVLAHRFKLGSLDSVDYWLCFAILLIAIMALIPEGVTGGSLMSFRMNLVFWLCALVWVAQVLFIKQVSWMRHGLLFIAILAACMQVMNTVNHLKKIQPFISAIEEVSEQIPDASLVWPVVMNPQGLLEDGSHWAPRNQWLVHSGLRFLGGKEDVVAVAAYQGVAGHFITKFKQPELMKSYSITTANPQSKDFITEDFVGWHFYIGCDDDMSKFDDSTTYQSTRFGGLMLINNKR